MVPGLPKWAKNGLFKALLHSSAATRGPRIVKPSGKVLWTHSQLRFKFVPNGQTRDGAGPLKWAKMDCLGHFFTVAPQPDDLGLSNFLERFFGHIASSGKKLW